MEEKKGQEPLIYIKEDLGFLEIYWLILFYF